MIVSFGEMLMRLEVPSPLRFSQSFPGPLQVTFAGAEFNMAVGIAALGGTSRFSTTLPDHDLAQAALRQMKAWGVETSSIRSLPFGRLGTYYLEHGAGLRGGQVIYDREGSTFSQASEGDYDWESIYQGATTLLISAISPAVSERACEVSRKAVQEAKKRGLRLVLDLNYRSKLWKWRAGKDSRELARETMVYFIEQADDLLTNLGQLIDVVGLDLPDANAPTEAAAQRGVEKLLKKYPKIKKVLITLRESLSASHHRWAAFGYDSSLACGMISPQVAGAYLPYEIDSIVDRVGVGDAFGAAYLRSLQLPFSFQESLDYATAAGALAHYVHGDLFLYSHEEVLSVMRGSRAGQIRR